MTLPITIRKEGGIPIYLQLGEQIRLMIHSGRLGPGEPMPTVREMAVTLELNYNTVARVYRDLQRDGLLVLKRGIGTFVGEGEPAAPLAKESLDQIREKARELIGLSRTTKIKPFELFQLIETMWKEVEHEER